jgi:hypothetical protein
MRRAHALNRSPLAIISAAILRDACLRRAPQDEGFFRGDTFNPHGEEARSAVSNHEARISSDSAPAFSRSLRQEALA